jgi:hypothetical protein
VHRAVARGAGSGGGGSSAAYRADDEEAGAAAGAGGEGPTLRKADNMSSEKALQRGAGRDNRSGCAGDHLLGGLGV